MSVSDVSESVKLSEVIFMHPPGFDSTHTGVCGINHILTLVHVPSVMKGHEKMLFCVRGSQAQQGSQLLFKKSLQSLV